MSWKKLFYVTAFSAILLLSFRAAIHHFDPITAVEMGMSPAAVAHVMGAPLSTAKNNQSTVYSYPKAKIFFARDRVVGIVTDAK